ncbi:MAG: type IV toxin-antitoxin system AbiEi family antitoxin domain-containing protein [Bryobacterales bacterium]|nr:type IV toxin-antitoxin system AbiEi family antitoxin domain-containing protein [Bryobacterales bacterium]
MPQTRLDELVALAEEHDGLFTAEQARQSGFTDSVIARLTQRGRLERMSRGVYRIPYVPINRLSQYREAVLWARSHRGPADVALSHETALVIYGISDASPGVIHLTVPRAARLRRAPMKSVALHRDELAASDVTVIEGLPVTSVSRTVADLLDAGGRTDLIRQAIAEARREGYISANEAQRLRRTMQRHLAGARAS